MKKENFTENEKNGLETLLNSISPDYTVEFNKAGNLTVRKAGYDEWWTLYHSEVNNNGYVWRRLWKDWCGGYRSHLLNCHGRKTVVANNYVYKTWDGVNAHAVVYTFDEVIEYAKKYFKEK